MPLRRGNWDRFAIKAEINRRGKTLTRLAIEMGLHESAVRLALIVPYPKADSVISKFLSVPLHNLWPDRYDSHGNRLLSRSNPSKSTQVRTSKKGRAA